MSIIPAETQRACEAGLRSVYGGDPARLEAELRIFRLTCQLGESGGLSVLPRLAALGAFRERRAKQKGTP